MSPLSSPQARVEAFITDWHHAWQEARARMGKQVDFEGWGEVVRGIDQRHFAEGKGCGSAGHFGSEPEHDPGAEKVTAVVPDGATARVETTHPADRLGRYHEYQLTERDGDWRITRLLSSLHAPDAPFLSDKQRAELLAGARPDAPLAPLPEDVPAAALGELFTAGRSVKLGDQEVTTEVRRLGELQLTSGVIGVHDFGSLSASHLDPLKRSVPPGKYPVEIVLAGVRVAAVRVVLAASATTTGWHPADVSRGGHVVGVDAGNVALFDQSSLAALKARALDQLYDRQVVQNAEQPLARLFSLAPADPALTDAVVVESGYGDGGYPVYWGVDSHGALTTLLVDFQILTAPDEG